MIDDRVDLVDAHVLLEVGEGAGAGVEPDSGVRSWRSRYPQFAAGRRPRPAAPKTVSSTTASDGSGVRRSDVAELGSQEQLGHPLELRRVTGREELVPRAAVVLAAASRLAERRAYTSFAVSSAEDTRTTSGPSSSCSIPDRSG